jgi:hypothetical protein
MNLFYTATRDEVIPVWLAWEDELFTLQTIIEKMALEPFEKNLSHAQEYLTGYSNWRATEAIEISRSMIRKLHTIIAHCNTPL